MRVNKYSYITELNKETSVIFNGITKDFIVVPNNLISSYEAIVSNPDKYAKSHPKIIKELSEVGIIVDDGYDELGVLRSEREAFTKSSIYKTSIIPTFDCNYNCWYCTQNHRKVSIDEKIINRIIKHVKKYLIDNHMTEYILSWFGGEPLMEPEIIASVSKELKGFCDNNNIKFHGAITTNGALLSREIIEMLKDNSIRYFQIAIDGDKQSHDKNKYDNIHPSSFELILNNMVALAHNHHEAEITLRLNFTPLNLDNEILVDEINAVIPKEIRRRINIDLHRIWQIDERKYEIQKLNVLQKKFVESGYTLATDHVFSMCYVDKIHYNTIYYNGGVEKCDEKTMDNLRGFIDDEGDIKWKEKPKFIDLDILGDKSPCASCNYYPLCYGGCPVKRDHRIGEDGKLRCGFDGDFSKLDHRIKDYCCRVLNNKFLTNVKDGD